MILVSTVDQDVVLNDLGGITLTHLTENFDILTLVSEDEIRDSQDFQDALDNNKLTATNSVGEPITVADGEINIPNRGTTASIVPLFFYGHKYYRNTSSSWGVASNVKIDASKFEGKTLRFRARAKSRSNDMAYVRLFDVTNNNQICQVTVYDSDIEWYESDCVLPEQEIELEVQGREGTDDIYIYAALLEVK